MIEHITSVDNVMDGMVHDPTKVKHGVIVAKRIWDLSWWIDPATHLNLDDPAQLMDVVYVASRLEIGAKVLTEKGRLSVAPVDPAAYRNYGKVFTVERGRRIRMRQLSQG